MNSTVRVESNMFKLKCIEHLRDGVKQSKEHVKWAGISLFGFSLHNK